MLHKLAVENLKCGGCAATIARSLKKLPGIRMVSVDTENGTVNLDADEVSVERAKLRLSQLGYPLVGSASGAHSAVAAAKSYISCAIGRVSGQ
jgi:copper chaperone